MYNDWIEESNHSLRLCQQGIDPNSREAIEGQEAFLKKNMPVKQYSYLFLWEIPELVNKTQDHIGISAFIDKSLLKYGEIGKSKDMYNYIELTHTEHFNNFTKLHYWLFS